MVSFPWSTPASRTTGISSQSINDGNSYVGSEIDNSVNLDDTMDIEVLFTCSVAPSAYTAISIYILYSLGGTDYEDGGEVKPTTIPESVSARNVTSAQRVVLPGIPISPLKLKILAWNDLGQTAVVTVACKTYRRGYAS